MRLLRSRLKNEMAVRNGLEKFLAEPLPEFHHTFLMTRWTETPSLTRECKQIFMTTITTPDTCKAMMQDTAIKISINDLSYIGAKKTILLGKALIVDLWPSEGCSTWLGASMWVPAWRVPV